MTEHIFEPHVLLGGIGRAVNRSESLIEIKLDFGEADSVPFYSTFNRTKALSSDRGAVRPSRLLRLTNTRVSNLHPIYTFHTSARRTDDDLYDLYDLLPLHDLDLSRQIDSWSV